MKTCVTHMMQSRCAAQDRIAHDLNSQDYNFAASAAAQQHALWCAGERSHGHEHSSTISVLKNILPAIQYNAQANLNFN